MCLPLYDHFCPFVNIPVYLNTFKPYMTYMWSFFIHICFTVPLSIKSLAAPKAAREIYMFYWLVAIFGLAISAWVLVETLIKQTWRIVLHNTVGTEIRHPKRNFIIGLTRATAEEERLQIIYLDFNPWDRGMWKNSCTVYGGSFLEWLMPFYAPERVWRYGKTQGGILDELFSDRCRSRLTQAHEEWNSMRGVGRRAAGLHRRSARSHQSV
jgi:hypothetical protein